MESLFSLPLPFQRRLTKMYTDTKSSYDFVKEPIQAAEDPELLSLHRKLRIQKDRLVSWGLEWSEEQSPDIDESINKAGLSELVGSVMGTIKEVLAEAEPLWLASKRPLALDGEKRESKIVWDKTRFQDLVRDLTMSIDTLYDLSRTRQSARKPTPQVKREEGRKSTGLEERLFESTRMQAPQQIDPKSLIWPWDLKSIQPGLLPPAKSHRQIVFMRRPIPSSEARKLGQPLPVVPVLLEFAGYDPIYSFTGIPPSMSRFERLFAALTQSYISSERNLTGLLQLIGYFEEAEHSRFCLLYALPTHFGPIDIESPRMPSIVILSDLLYSNNYEPTLEVKYRLAHNVATAVFDLHSKGVVHGNVMASNVLFIEHPTQNRLDLSQVNMRQSFLASCDLFSDTATDSSEASATLSTSLHRHPLDPRTTRYTHLTSESKSLDLYSLAMLLLEIGLWTSLHDVFPTVSALPENPAAVFKQLAARCGSLYVKAVQACWHAPEDELSQKARPDVMHQKLFWKVSKALDTCCAIDESSDEELDEGDDSPPMPSTPVRESTLAPPRRMLGDQKSPSISNLAASASATRRPSWTEKPVYASFPPEKVGWEQPIPVVQAVAPRSTPPAKVEKTKPKLRTYPSIRIAQEHLDFWHTGLMPHINHVLRHFYKKYPESVEISLESIGESSLTTKPTILVICTSVTKVRSILKKSLIYDKSTYGLKVCRGKVVRSRKHGVKRSMMNEAGDLVAANGSHQDRPCNGASIGAYVNNHHLPPVSFGGLIMIDDKPYGMTVHHMLDDPSDDEESPEDAVPTLRSSARSHLDMPDLTHSESSYYSSGDEEYMYALSDYASTLGDSASDYQDSETSSQYASDSEDDAETELEAGDIRGIPAGCGEEYLITQPAIDDVSESFYPVPETRDEDHLDSFQLGEVYASSGIRRRVEGGLVHEIDWALFEFESHRAPVDNHIPNGSRFCSAQSSSYPLAIAPVEELHGLDVHCMARTSGLQSGRILPGMVIVKIFGRQTPSSSFAVAGKLGVPGDSGAWVVDNERGRACGHVLAWSTRKRVAYIAPMDVSVRDIGETLGARSISLPGGNELFSHEGTITQTPSNIIRTENLNFDESKFRNQTTVEAVGIDDELANMMRELNLPPTPSQIDAHHSDERGRAEHEHEHYPSTSDHPSPLVSPLTPSPFPDSNTNTLIASATTFGPLLPNPFLAGGSGVRTPFIPIKLMTRDGANKTARISKRQHMDFLKVWGGINDDEGGSVGSSNGGSREPSPAGVGRGEGMGRGEIVVGGGGGGS